MTAVFGCLLFFCVKYAQRKQGLKHVIVHFPLQSWRKLAIMKLCKNVQ